MQSLFYLNWPSSSIIIAGMMWVFVFTALAVNLFKLWAGTLYPITCDEAYYWLWHQHLALSFVDHPPFIAYFNKLVSFFGAYNLSNFRLAAVGLSLLATYFVWATGKVLFNERVGLIAATLFQLVPHYIVIWQTLTVDNPLALFWLIALYLFARIVRRGKASDWYWFGLVFGLGLLSKYTIIFFLPLLFLALVILPEQRRWFARKEPYLAAVLALLVFSPVIIWNIQHHFVSLAFHSSRLVPQVPWQNMLDFLADQLVHFSPFLFLGLIIYGQQLWQKSRFLWLFSVPLLLLFFAFTILIKVWAHWVTAYQFAAVIGIAAMVADNLRTAKKLIISLWVFDLILVAVLLFGQATILPRQNEYRKNYQLEKSYALIPVETPVITPYLGIASQLSFYAHRTIYMAEGELKLEKNGFGFRQFQLWGYPVLKRGGEIIYYGRPDEETRQLLRKHFVRVEVEPTLEIYLMESYLDQLVPYHCRGFRGKTKVL